MEIVDIIDENNNVLYQTTKQEAHETGLLHRCVISEVIDSKARIALVKQTSDRQDAGQYVSPVGGHVKAGESEEDALKREGEEEIGLKDFKFKFVGRAIYDRKVIGRHENHMFVLYEIHTDEELVLGDEAESYKWFTIEELKKELKENPKMFGDAYWFVVRNFYPELLA